MKTDILIVGSGVSGLYCALNLPRDKQILIITKDKIFHSDSYLAQGGICVLKDEQDYDSFFEDTMKAGHYENKKESVDIMIQSSRDIIKDLVSYGVRFEKENGEFVYTKEGAHSKPRILYHADETGKEITRKLYKEVKKYPNITILEHYTMVDVLCQEDKCYGIVCSNKEKEYFEIQADYTVFATGGIGGLFENSTNFRHLTGDALAVAIEHNITLKDIDYIQIHPTTFYTKKRKRKFLISESVRGEGAILLNKKGERFVDELLPRDKVSKAIMKEMEKEGSSYVRLSLEHMNEEKILSHFPNIYKQCLKEGYDITKEPIPVVPAQHYFMGGILVDEYSKTSMERLYAVGETACNGVHGKNRLASNSLLESLVFAKRAAKNIDLHYTKLPDREEKVVCSDKYKDISNHHKWTVLDAIEKERKSNE